MSDLRTAAQQALEALKYYRSREDYQPTPASEAITALKAALAEPQEQRSQGDRRLKNATTRLGIICYDAYARSHTGTKRWDIAAEAVRAALAESDNEEVY